MDPTIPQPFLTPRQGELLTALYSHRLDILSLAAHEQLSYYELERFTAAIQPHLATLQSFLELTLPLRTLTARFAILTHLEEAAKTAQNPTEKRLAATALLRAISSATSPRSGGVSASSPPGGGAAPRGGGGSVSTSSTSSPSTSDTPCDSDTEARPLSPLPYPDPSLSLAYRAAAAAILSDESRGSSPDSQPAQAEGLNVSSRGSTRFASPPEFPSISRTLKGCSSYLPHQPSARHARRPFDVASRAGQAPITTLEPLARPP